MRPQLDSARQCLSRWIVGASLACCAMLAQATPVTLYYTGTVSSYLFGTNLSTAMPLGSAVSLTLSFNETFSDGSYAFSDNLGPVSGLLNIAGLSYAFDGYVPNQITYDGGGDLSAVTPKFTGSGPAVAGGNLAGLYLALTPDLGLAHDPQLGFGFDVGNGVTIFQYAIFSGQGRIVPNGVPEPASLAVLALGLAALATARRRRAWRAG